MKITVTITQKNPAHITFDVFVAGARSGSLVLRNEEWQPFMEILQPDKIYDYTSAGWPKSEEVPKTSKAKLLLDFCDEFKNVYKNHVLDGVPVKESKTIDRMCAFWLDKINDLYEENMDN